MSKVIVVKQETDGKAVRRCKNCGKDISNKRKDAQFCCKICYMSYTNRDRFAGRYYSC